MWIINATQEYYTVHISYEGSIFQILFDLIRGKIQVPNKETENFTEIQHKIQNRFNLSKKTKINKYVLVFKSDFILSLTTHGKINSSQIF